MIYYVPTGDERALEAANYLVLGDEERVRVHGIGDPVPDDSTFIFSSESVRGQLEVLRCNGTPKLGASIPPVAGNAKNVVVVQKNLPFRSMKAAIASESLRDRKYGLRLKGALDSLHHTLTGERLHPKLKKPRVRRQQPVLCGGGGWRTED